MIDKQHLFEIAKGLRRLDSTMMATEDGALMEILKTETTGFLAVVHIGIVSFSADFFDHYGGGVRFNAYAGEAILFCYDLDNGKLAAFPYPLNYYP